MTDWIDITYPINENMLHWPGQPKVSISKHESMENGDAANVSILHLSAHTGTHIDAPLHFIEGGKDVTQMPDELKTGKVKVFQTEEPLINRSCIMMAESRMGHLHTGDRLFFRTKNSDTDWINHPFPENYVGITAEAAQYLRMKGVALVGIDFLTIGAPDQGEQVHKEIMGNNCWVVEGLQMKDLSEGIYEYMCLPLKIEGCDGAPAQVMVRPFALKEEKIV